MHAGRVAKHRRRPLRVPQYCVVAVSRLNVPDALSIDIDRTSLSGCAALAQHDGCPRRLPQHGLGPAAGGGGISDALALGIEGERGFEALAAWILKRRGDAPLGPQQNRVVALRGVGIFYALPHVVDGLNNAFALAARVW